MDMNQAKLERWMKWSVGEIVMNLEGGSSSASPLVVEEYASDGKIRFNVEKAMTDRCEESHGDGKIRSCVMFPFSTIFPLIWDLGLWQKGQRHLDDIKLARRNQPLDYVRTKTDAVNLLYYYTFSAGSPEFPFKSLWFSSLVLLSFVNGNATGPERSGNSG
nr:uncharacterized protein LOC109179309 [Ipomoea batatas]GMC95352.1 uncharacterized protein LOC109179309 [Ipomoea batatas]